MNDNMIISLKEPKPAVLSAPIEAPVAAPVEAAVPLPEHPLLPQKRPAFALSLPFKPSFLMTKAVGVAVLGIVVSAGAFSLLHGSAAPARSESASAVASVQQAAPVVDVSDAASVVGAVGKLIELPVGEEPTIARVSDLSKLSGQQFFQNAKVGDIVLMFAGAKKAILYDPSENKLVEVAPLALSASSTPQ